jgi:hypothetical protein
MPSEPCKTIQVGDGLNVAVSDVGDGPPVTRCFKSILAVVMWIPACLGGTAN